MSGTKPLALDALTSAWTNYGAVPGAVIDQGFIERGFSSVRAQIEFIGAVYGPHAYAVDLETHSSQQTFLRTRALAEEVEARTAALSDGFGDEADQLWTSIAKDARLPSFVKRDAFRAISEERYGALIAPHVLVLKQALINDQHTLCTIYSEPAISLYSKDRTNLRKEVLNATMLEAYGALGFEPFKTKQKVRSFIKRVSPQYSIVIQPDIVALNGDYSAREQYESPLIYWPLISYDRSCLLTSADGGTKILHLGSAIRCIALERASSYDTTLSMECMIRADALWYELALAPFERELIRL